MKHYSPSFVGSLALCARCTPDDEVTNEAAENGTKFHDVMFDTITKHKPSEYEAFLDGLELSDDTRAMCKEALARASGFLCLGLPVYAYKRFDYSMDIEEIEPGIYAEAEVELWPGDRRHKVGRIDLLVVMQPGYAVIIDWKSNVADSDFSWQLDSYAGALKRLCKKPWKQIIGKIIAPNLEVHEDIVYDMAAIGEAERRILGVEERANNPFAPACPGEKQCKYCRCRRLGQCPALVKATADKLPTASEVPTDVVVQKDTDLVEYQKTVDSVLAARRIILKPKDLVDRSLRRDWMACVSMLVDYIKADDKAYFQKEEHATEQLPGYKVSTRDGNRVIDTSKLKELNKRLMQEFGLDCESLLACLEPNHELLVERAALKLGTKKAAEERYSEVVDLFSKRGAPITTLRRDAARKLIKVKVTE